MRIFTPLLGILLLAAQQGQCEKCVADTLLAPTQEELFALPAANVPAEELIRCPAGEDADFVSRTLGRHTRATFENRATVPVQLFWVSEQGDEINVLQEGFMLPGSRVSLNTHEGHVFVMRSAVSRELLLRYRVGAFVFENKMDLDCGQATETFYSRGKALMQSRNISLMGCGGLPKSYKNGSPCPFDVYWVPQNSNMQPEFIAQLLPQKVGDMTSVLLSTNYHSEYTYLTHVFTAVLPSGLTMDTKVVAPVEATDCSLGTQSVTIGSRGTSMVARLTVPPKKQLGTFNSSTFCDPLSGACSVTVSTKALFGNETRLDSWSVSEKACSGTCGLHTAVFALSH